MGRGRAGTGRVLAPLHGAATLKARQHFLCLAHEENSSKCSLLGSGTFLLEINGEWLINIHDIL